MPRPRRWLDQVGLNQVGLGQVGLGQFGLVLVGVFVLAFAGILIGQTGDTVVPADASSDTYQLPVSHPECTFFGPRREGFVRESLKARGARNADTYALSSTTE